MKPNDTLNIPNSIQEDNRQMNLARRGKENKFINKTVGILQIWFYFFFEANFISISLNCAILSSKSFYDDLI